MSSNAVSIGQAALVFHDATRLLDSALGVAALSYEAAGADLAVLDPCSFACPADEIASTRVVAT